MENQVLIHEGLPPMPRIGLELRLPGRMDQMAWFGRGPHENYVDRKLGAGVGLYHSRVADQFTPYVYPSECGGREDVRWVALTDDAGQGLLVLGLDPLHMACEGRLVAIVAAGDADRALAALQGHEHGGGAARIGAVNDRHAGVVTMATALGVERVLDMPLGEQLPRIC